MASFQPSRPRPSSPQRLLRSMRRSTPLAVWLGAVVAVCWLGTSLPPSEALRALVESPVGTVSTPVDGRVQTLLVGLHDDVAAGAIVARLDDSDVRLRLSKASYELERLRADMDLEQRDRAQQARDAAVEHELDSGAEQRRLASTVEAAELAALATRTQLEEARVRLQGVTVEAERQQELTQKGIVGQTEMVRIDTERRALHRRVSELEAYMAEHKERIATAQQRLQDFKPEGLSLPAIDSALAPMRWRLKEQEAELERIANDARRLDLRAPIAGRIVAVNRHAGEWASAGTPLLSIVDPQPRRILAYVPERVRSRLLAQQEIAILRQDNTRLGTSRIVSISPTVVRLPERLWRDPQQEEWGFELAVAATGAEMPGERLLLSPRF